MDNKKDFIAFIKANEGIIYKITKVYTHNREDAQDLYQEIVYQLWKSFASFKQEAKLSTWLYRVALNTAIGFLNKTNKSKTHTTIDEALMDIAETTNSEQEEKIEQLYSFIKTLNTIEKGIILLYLEEKSYEEIAAVTGFTVTNIGTRLGRIKQKLIHQIKK